MKCSTEGAALREEPHKDQKKSISFCNYEAHGSPWKNLLKNLILIKNVILNLSPFWILFVCLRLFFLCQWRMSGRMEPP